MPLRRDAEFECKIELKTFESETEAGGESEIHTRGDYRRIEAAESI